MNSTEYDETPNCIGLKLKQHSTAMIITNMCMHTCTYIVTATSQVLEEGKIDYIG